jgi:hypothetical protein
MKRNMSKAEMSDRIKALEDRADHNKPFLTQLWSDRSSQFGTRERVDRQDLSAAIRQRDTAIRERDDALLSFDRVLEQNDLRRRADVVSRDVLPETPALSKATVRALYVAAYRPELFNPKNRTASEVWLVETLQDHKLIKLQSGSGLPEITPFGRRVLAEKVSVIKKGSLVD